MLQYMRSCIFPRSIWPCYFRFASQFCWLLDLFWARIRFNFNHFILLDLCTCFHDAHSMSTMANASGRFHTSSSWSKKKWFDHHQRPSFNQIVKEINNFDWIRLSFLSFMCVAALVFFLHDTFEPIDHVHCDSIGPTVMRVYLSLKIFLSFFYFSLVAHIAAFLNVSFHFLATQLNAAKIMA